MAKDQMEKTFKEMAKDPESVKLTNSETVYYTIFLPPFSILSP